jgi:hypothetical protein
MLFWLIYSLLARHQGPVWFYSGRISMFRLKYSVTARVEHYTAGLKDHLFTPRADRHRTANTHQNTASSVAASRPRVIWVSGAATATNPYRNSFGNPAILCRRWDSKYCHRSEERSPAQPGSCELGAVQPGLCGTKQDAKHGPSVEPYQPRDRSALHSRRRRRLGQLNWLFRCPTIGRVEKIDLALFGSNET